MKKGQKLTEFIQAHWLWAYVVAMLLIPGIVDGFMYLAIPTRPDLTAPTWLTFWGSYLGGAIGCLPALAAYRHSIDESKRQHEEFQEQLLENRRQSDEQYKSAEKDRHLSHLPVIDNQITLLRSISDLSSISHPSIQVLYEQLPGSDGHYIRTPNQSELLRIFAKNDHDIILFHVRNIGHGPALSIKITSKTTSSVSIGALGEKDSYTFIFCLSPSGKSPHHFKFSYSDMLGWHYQQLHDFQIGVDRLFSAPIQPPEIVE